MKVGSLFSGIGGLDLGLSEVGFTHEWFCECDEYASEILGRHWPAVPRYNNVRGIGAGNLAPVDILAGGFPCQDVSSAGHRAGIEAGERSGLWSEFHRLIGELRPKYAIIENVQGLLTCGMRRVLADLAAIGFDAEWQVIQASDFGLPHTRRRLFIVAYPNGEHGQAGLGNEQHGPIEVFSAGLLNRLGYGLQAAGAFAGMDDGIPAGLYEKRVRGLGNAVCPVIGAWLGLLIQRRERLCQ